MCIPRLTLKEQKIFTFEESHVHKACTATSKDTHQWLGSTISYTSSTIWNSFHANTYKSPYIPRNYASLTIQWLYSFHLPATTIDTSQHWHFAGEYSIWTAAVAGLQFWIADLKPHILSDVIDWVYAAFFYCDYTEQIWSLPEETLISCFVATLNDVFETELAQEYEGYESGSESFNIPFLSAEHQESTMPQQGRNYPLIL